ncbi:MAG: tetratricopeptide repeat protein [Acidobacteria bacterium]|nr:tetratricopeptide repeat protein [Acidobacteriota bacterium]
MLPMLREAVFTEVERISRSGLLTGQQRDVLAFLVETAVSGSRVRLRQKDVAKALDIPSPGQVGVIVTNTRTRLYRFYESAPGGSALHIALSDRGYDVIVSQFDAPATLSDEAQLAVADAKAALDQRTLPGAATAIGILDKVLVREPDNPVLMALKAHCYATRALYGTHFRRDLEAAERIVETLRTREPRTWESWFAEASVHMALHWDWPAAGAAFAKAIALSGGTAARHPWHTAYLASQGRAAEAVALLRAAVAQSHDSPIVRADLAINQIFAHQYEEAAVTIDTAFALFGDRTHYLLHVHRAILREATGDPAGALASVVGVPLRWPHTAVTIGLRALFAGLAGDRRTARRHLTKLQAARMLAKPYVPAGQLCIAALGAGDVDGAVEWLRLGAVVERDPNLVLTGVYPFFRHLQGHPGFDALVRDTMRLPAARF